MSKRKISLHLKGYFYAIDTDCATLKEWLENHHGFKRSDIKEWWYT